MGAALLVIASLFPADSRDDAAWAEFKKFEGTWKLAVVESHGERRTNAPDIWVVHDGQAKVYANKAYLLTYIHKLDPALKPKAIDQYTDFRDGKPTTTPVRGIYEIDGDTWRICYNMSAGAERPKEFTGAKNTNCRLYTLKRVSR
jgi:uncharacterized protein (TIGR03067 family)